MIIGWYDGECAWLAARFDWIYHQIYRELILNTRVTIIEKHSHRCELARAGHQVLR